MTAKVVVIGGGMAGLETAVSLASTAAVEVDVIERGPALRKDHVEWDVAIYPGDEKTHRWTGDGWGVGGGLSERLGGRSLCYHGVVLPIEPEALSAWPAQWQAALAGSEGWYERVAHALAPDFPELPDRELSAPAREVGLKHVPQAAQFDAKTRRMRAYSPLSKALELARNPSRFCITRGAVTRVERQSGDRWRIQVVGPDGEKDERGDFVGCVLASSAIGNVQILANTLRAELETPITDHFCSGVLARFATGEPLEIFRHRKLWTGYLPAESLGANIFIQEMAPLDNGDRMVEVFAVIEQGASASDYSRLTCKPDESAAESTTYIEARVSQSDSERLAAVTRETVEVATRISNQLLEDITELKDRAAVESTPRGHAPGGDERWLSYESALQALVDQQEGGKLARFTFPYGAFEHESCTHPIGKSGHFTIKDDLEVDELPGVYAVGPGSFARPGAANPALTILAMSRRLGAMLGERFS